MNNNWSDHILPIVNRKGMYIFGSPADLCRNGLTIPQLRAEAMIHRLKVNLFTDLSGRIWVYCHSGTERLIDPPRKA